MATISSDDCKAFLQQHYHFEGASWKRRSKKKDAQGRIVREFVHSTAGSVFLAEGPLGLVDITAEFLMPTTLGPWDSTRRVFDPLDLAAAQRMFDDASEGLRTLDSSAFGYHAMPGLFSFWFQEGDHAGVVRSINKANDPNAIVTGLSVFMEPRHMDYGCEHLSWAVQAFVPPYFYEDEESAFSLHREWSSVYDEKRQAAVDNGTIPAVRLMELFQELKQRGFHYRPSHCAFKKLLSQGREFCA